MASGSAVKQWKKYDCPAGLPFYYNSRTKQSCWEQPAAIVESGKDLVTIGERVIATRLIEGTQWVLAVTSWKRHFYFNLSTMQSCWIPPQELLIMMMELRKQLQAASVAEEQQDKRHKMEASNVDGENDNDDVEQAGEPVQVQEAVQEQEAGQEQEPGQVQVQEEDNEAVSREEADIVQEFNEDDIEEQLRLLEQEQLEAQAAQEIKEKSAEAAFTATTSAPDVPLSAEQDEDAYMTLLEEAKVNAFSSWDSIASKLSRDNRFLAIPLAKRRKELFERFCIRQAEISKQSQAVSIKSTPKERFQSLLDEVIADHRARWDDFSRQYRKDSRFTAVSLREREKLFAQHVRRLADNRKDDKKRTEKAFLDLLAELVSGEITRDTRYTNVKDRLRNDPRYEAVGSSRRREELFKEFQVQVTAAAAAAKPTPNDSVDRKTAALQNRQKDAANDQRRLDAQVARSKSAAQYETAVRVFQQLLTDFVHNQQQAVSWSGELRARLESDERFKVCQTSLNDEEQLRLFRQHLDELRQKEIRKFELVLDSLLVDLPSARMSFTEDIQPLVINDPRLHRILRHPLPNKPSQESAAEASAAAAAVSIDREDRRFLEQVFMRYLDRRLDKLRTDFRHLLRERTDLLTYRFVAAEKGSSGAGVGEEEEDEAMAVKQALNAHQQSVSLPKVDYSEAVELLREDSRYRRMQVLGGEREQAILEWLESTGLEYQRKKYIFH